MLMTDDRRTMNCTGGRESCLVVCLQVFRPSPVNSDVIHTSSRASPMPWSCPTCSSTTELGYNICRSCGRPRPGAEPPSLSPRRVRQPFQYTTARLLGATGCIACGLAFTFQWGLGLLGSNTLAEFHPLHFCAGSGLWLGATIGTVLNGGPGFVRGAISGILLGCFFPIVLVISYIVLMVATGQDWFPGVAD